MKLNIYNCFVKRFLDIVLSLLGIIILAPVFLIVAIAIKIDSPGPVFFKQKRIGLYKKTFIILKYRTLKINAPKDTPTHLLENPEQYHTRLSKFIRKSSIDELPQLFNILMSKMSIVGPRPALWNQYDLIEKREKYGANDIRPGLTGWAQVNGRDELPIDVKAKFDGEYINKMSFLFDCKCFFMTIFKVLKSDGVVEGASNAPVPVEINDSNTYEETENIKELVEK